MGQEESTLIEPTVAPRTLSARSLDAVADYIKNGDVGKITVLTGAGISTAAGIPDFRSPKTGLYSNLERLNLPHAEAVFDIEYFRKNPDPFYVLAKELYPGKFHPTISHAFIALLAKKGLLQKLFTQNIDCLERRAGVPEDKIIEAHGSFATQRCIECKSDYPEKEMKEHVFEGRVPRCLEKRCDGLVKPDIVFFGEGLPMEFSYNSPLVGTSDLVLIIGTSLTVFPFAGLPELAAPGKPRVLFNMERVGKIGSRTDDVQQLGPCDEGIRKLADKLGWREELEAFWREIVGHKEAARQNASQDVHDQEVEDEVEKLAEGVEAALHLEENKGKPETESTDTIDTTASQETAQDKDAKQARNSLVQHGSGLPSTEDLPAKVEKAEEKSKADKAEALNGVATSTWKGDEEENNPLVKNDAGLESTTNLPEKVGKSEDQRAE